MFEYKDAYIDKKTKVSRDITQIKKELRNKFFETSEGKSKGIKQLLKHIELINNKKFEYDDNLNKNYTIYPILLISHRLLEITGMNFIMNKWFKDELKKINLRKEVIVKDLIIIDIDTLIYYKEYYREKDKHFKETLDKHINNSKANYKGYGKTEKEIMNNIYSKLEKKMLPYSYRMERWVFTNPLVRQNTYEFIEKLFSE